MAQLIEKARLLEPETLFEEPEVDPDFDENAFLAASGIEHEVAPDSSTGHPGEDEFDSDFNSDEDEDQEMGDGVPPARTDQVGGGQALFDVQDSLIELDEETRLKKQLKVCLSLIHCQHGTELTSPVAGKEKTHSSGHQEAH
jgi:hypothetical protein